jgi:ubiquinone biosynthesis monooxygenase Coq7
MDQTVSLPNETLDQMALGVPGLIGDLRSDHAGETGAVMIYRGILAGCRDPAVRAFAAEHMATEVRHLALMDALLPKRERSVLLPIWRVAGWLTGFLPALVGSNAIYATIDAVETFVDHHYEEQIRKLPEHGPGGALRAILVSCQADEVHHRDEARGLGEVRRGMFLRAWSWAVGFGSASAVSAARRI